MGRSQLEYLILYQDIDLMLQDSENESKTMGFSVDGKEKLDDAKRDLAKSISPRFMGAYQRIHQRYKRPIAPVKDDTCLGCFAKLPTSYTGKGRDSNSIITCEQCGRILYWIE